jgi:hypothetical protein
MLASAATEDRTSSAIMASPVVSLETAIESLQKNGYAVLDDAQVGELVLRLQQHGFQFLSQFGIDYCRDNIFKHNVGSYPP